jgi:hypothetical protein
MIQNPLLASESAERLRISLLIAAAIAGLIASVVVLSSQEVTDFLREGPARLLDIRGDTLQVVLGAGSAIATVVALASMWLGAHRYRYLLAAIALIVGLFLIHIMMAPAVTLFLAAAVADGSSRVSREQLVAAGPRRHPAAWLGGSVLGVGAAVALIWATVWLATPLFDDGTELNEMLAFNVEGLEQPEVVPISSAGSSAGTESSGTEDVGLQAAESDSVAGEEEAAAEAEVVASNSVQAETELVSPNAEDEGVLISQGELMGADAFHAGSGAVLLVQSPTGETILRFQDFRVRNGPDLRVYLSPDPGGSVRAEGAISLGTLRGTSGFINYTVPADVDPTVFRSVIIYCEPFGVVFATAVLS